MINRQRQGGDGDVGGAWIVAVENVEELDKALHLPPIAEGEGPADTKVNLNGGSAAGLVELGLDTVRYRAIVEGSPALIPLRQLFALERSGRTGRMLISATCDSIRSRAYQRPSGCPDPLSCTVVGPDWLHNGLARPVLVAGDRLLRSVF
jgi:hypothetical protein